MVYVGQPRLADCDQAAVLANGLYKRGGGAHAEWAYTEITALPDQAFRKRVDQFRGELRQQIGGGNNGLLYLPGVRFPPNVRPTGSLAEACADADMLVFVCPSSAVRGLAEALGPLLRGSRVLVSAAKGVEQGTHCTMSVMLIAWLPPR